MSDIILTLGNFRIRREDKLNLVLEELKDVQKQKPKRTVKEWKLCGYHANLRHALNAVVDKLPFGPSDDAKDILDEIEALRKEIRSAV